MNRVNRLIRLGQVFAIKLANINAEDVRNEVTSALEVALKNASSNTSIGILPFEKMAISDELNLIININRDDGLGHKFTVDVKIDTPEKMHLLPKYQPLKNQIENYLTRNWEIYPGSINGEKVDYRNFTSRLSINENPVKKDQVTKT